MNNYKTNLFKTITIRTVQGVGDILRVYQKLSPHFDKINIVICICDSNCSVQKRSLPFVKTLPKINYIKFKLVTSEYYDKLAASKKTMDDVLFEYQQNIFPIEYAVNRWLEDGCRLNKIDSYDILETVDILCKPMVIPFNKYIILYISGNKIVSEWSPQQYAKLIKNTYDKFNVYYPIILLGADYDYEHLKQAEIELRNYNYETYMCINALFEHTNYIIKNAHYFIGYQSGLCIIADQFDIPQTMLYFNFLGNVMFSWPKQKNIDSNIYNAFKFEENVDCCNNFIK